MIELAAEIRDKFSGADAFEQVMALEGDVYRAKEGRRTLLFTHHGKEYFAKIHHGIGWGEIWKNLMSFRMPVIDASNEWKAVDVLEKVGVPTVKIVGKGVRGKNPARRESFVIMEALHERIEVEDFLKELHVTCSPQKGFLLKRAILHRVAGSAKRMHEAGMNHRDFYLCHFHILEKDWSQWVPGDPFNLPLLDLHRAQIRERVPHRWLAKDLGALLFSAIDCGITDRDIIRFLRVYHGVKWRKHLEDNTAMWRAVAKRAAQFYQKHRNKALQLLKNP